MANTNESGVQNEPVHSSVLVYGQEYNTYNFCLDHPLQSVRLRLTHELMRSLGILEHPGLIQVPPRMATDTELALIHSNEYIEKVKECSQPGCVLHSGDQAHGLGSDDNPIFVGMHKAAAYTVGGSLVAAEAVMGGLALHSFNMAGGLHHAHRDNAAGFCVYNDAAVAIESIRRKYDARVMYVDFDAHHGDGVQEAFYRTNKVLTVSIHESGEYLFPGTGDYAEVGREMGYGYAINVPLESYTFDEVYLEVFRQIVPEAAYRYRPDVIVSQLGCDTHWNDPLAHLMLTMQCLRTIYHEMHELAHEVCEGRWIAVGGGGYRVYTTVPKAWTMLFAEMCGFPLPDEVPPSWASISQNYVIEPVGLSLLDGQAPQLIEQREGRIRESARKATDYLTKAVLPLIQSSK